MLLPSAMKLLGDRNRYLPSGSKRFPGVARDRRAPRAGRSGTASREQVAQDRWASTWKGPLPPRALPRVVYVRLADLDVPA